METINELLLENIKDILTDKRGLTNWTNEQIRSEAIKNLCISYSLLNKEKQCK